MAVRPRSFYEQRYKAAALVYSGDKASMVQQNNAQIVTYVEEVNPIPRNFMPPFKFKVHDLIIDNGELQEKNLGKRYWLVRQRTSIGFRSQRVYSELPGLYDIDRSLFLKGTLGTLLSYRALLNARIVDRQPNQDFHTQTRATRARRNSLPSSVKQAAMVCSSSERSLEYESQSVTLRFFLENGIESKEIYATPIAGRIVLSRLKLELGCCGIEAVDAFELSRKGKLAWTRVQWSSPILVRPGDILFFRKVGITHMSGWEIDRHYL